MLLSTLKVANIHAILVEQWHGPLYRCILNRSIWIQSFTATLLYSIVSRVCFYLPFHLICLLGSWGAETISETRTFMVVLATTMILYFGAVVPIFIRVAAPLSPEQEKFRGQSWGIKSAWNGFH